jgi:hypothetical protein
MSSGGVRATLLSELDKCKSGLQTLLIALYAAITYSLCYGLVVFVLLL